MKPAPAVFPSAGRSPGHLPLHQGVFLPSKVVFYRANMAPEASAHFEGVFTVESLGEGSLLGDDIISLAAVSEDDSSGLLLDDPVFGFPGGSLFPAAIE